MRLKDFKPQGILPLMGDIALLVSIRSEDGGDVYAYVVRKKHGEVDSPVSKTRVHEDSKGHHFIDRKGVRYYLSEFAKIRK